MTTRRPDAAERALTSDREEYIVDMLFQLARIAAEAGDQEMSDPIHRLWEHFRERAARRVERLKSMAH